MSNQVKKNPAWLIYHGILLIWGGLGSFAMHASYTDMGHLVDITSVVFMLSFPPCYAVLNLFLEDINRYGFDLDIGDTIGYVCAPIFFLLNIMLGFWVEAKDSSVRFPSSNSGLRDNVMWISVVVYLGCIFLKWGKEVALGRQYSMNYWLVIISIISIFIAFCCQERILIKDLPCDPNSLF